jgi:hypothetical protein
MTLLSRPAAVFSVFFGFAVINSIIPPNKPEVATSNFLINKDPRIQVAILLDVSNSMDGLIEQAKAQLWNMVSVMGKAKCGEIAPKIEIALYEYGRDNNDAKLGYIKQVSPFTSDLDQLSQELFKLTTYGGSEYCGHVIHTSLNELAWDTSGLNYKVIFIAGNEDFLQGNISYTKACDEARKKGVIVNTIYCGDRAQGIREHWSLGSECGNGSFTNINSDARPEDILTPYDSSLLVLNQKLNSTYIYYGASGAGYSARQRKMDEANGSINTTVAANRTAAKANKGIYDNRNWDLSDAASADSTFIAKVDMKTLPDSLNKTRAELKQVVDKKNIERGLIQNEILNINKQRETFMTTERAKRAALNNTTTLETEVEKTIKQQAKRFNMIIQ